MVCGAPCFMVDSDFSLKQPHKSSINLSFKSSQPNTWTSCQEPKWKKLIWAFISSRVDYCNDLLSGLFKKNNKKLQQIQIAVAGVLTGTKRSDHITTILKALHWLPVNHRIQQKALLLVYKSIYGDGLKYITDMFCQGKWLSWTQEEGVWPGLQHCLKPINIKTNN